MYRTTYPLATDQRIVQIVGQAMKEGFRIMACADCGGPEIFSKKSALARCFRCGEQRELTSAIRRKQSWRRCALCHAQNMLTVPMNQKYCQTCHKLSDTDKRKRRSRQAEAATTEVHQKTSINTGVK